MVTLPSMTTTPSTSSAPPSAVASFTSCPATTVVRTSPASRRCCISSSCRAMRRASPSSPVLETTAPCPVSRPPSSRTQPTAPRSSKAWRLRRPTPMSPASAAQTSSPCPRPQPTTSPTLRKTPSSTRSSPPSFLSVRARSSASTTTPGAREAVTASSSPSLSINSSAPQPNRAAPFLTSPS